MHTIHSSQKKWLAPAKINRFLHITRQRADGYHELQTIFQFLDYADELYFSISNNKNITLKDPIEGVKAEDNLIIKAAKLLQNESHCPLGATISLTKRLPMGGGLGGGSSDAATTLVALNQLWQVNLETPQLASLGVQLGADVPIFVHGFSAWAEGVGEQLKPIQLDEPWFVILIPNVSVSTAKIFSDPSLKRNCTPINEADFFNGQGHNVCQALVCQLYPEVAEALDWLDQFAPAIMTGTGACIFAAFNTREEAQKILSKKPEKFKGFVAQGANQSPLYL